MRDDVRALVIEKMLDGKDVPDGEDLLISGLIDSLGVMRLVRLLEARFSITIPAEDVIFEHFASIDDLAAYVERRKAAG
ncbi:MAG: acyl carrier protein [Pseudomonadota bacterium]